MTIARVEVERFSLRGSKPFGGRADVLCAALRVGCGPQADHSPSGGDVANPLDASRRELVLTRKWLDRQSRAIAKQTLTLFLQ